LADRSRGLVLWPLPKKKIKAEKKIKIVHIDSHFPDRHCLKTEQTLTDLVNQGWKIVAGGGGDCAGFVVLQWD